MKVLLDLAGIGAKIELQNQIAIRSRSPDVPPISASASLGAHRPSLRTNSDQLQLPTPSLDLFAVLAVTAHHSSKTRAVNALRSTCRAPRTERAMRCRRGAITANQPA